MVYIRKYFTLRKPLDMTQIVCLVCHHGIQSTKFETCSYITAKKIISFYNYSIQYWSVKFDNGLEETNNYHLSRLQSVVLHITIPCCLKCCLINIVIKLFKTIQENENNNICVKFDYILYFNARE